MRAHLARRRRIGTIAHEAGDRERQRLSRDQSRLPCTIASAVSSETPSSARARAASESRTLRLPARRSRGLEALLSRCARGRRARTHARERERVLGGRALRQRRRRADVRPPSGLPGARPRGPSSASTRRRSRRAGATTDAWRPGLPPGYFAAYVLDPDGNNVEAVFHGPTTRSARPGEECRARDPHARHVPGSADRRRDHRCRGDGALASRCSTCRRRTKCGASTPTARRGPPVDPSYLRSRSKRQARASSFGLFRRFLGARPILPLIATVAFL
jgi:hypothetical protein